MSTAQGASAAALFSHLSKLAILCIGAWAGATAEVAYAGPTGEQVIRGNVTFERVGNRTIVRASNGSIISYLNFNIAHDEIVRFIQPNQLARVLNRINSNEPTIISGKLLANGQVYLVNPAGVVFGQGSVVDVGGLYAAAGQLSDKRFIKGIDKFNHLNGAVVNEGDIRGNQINLLGESVANHGRITSPKGLITMLAGDTAVITRQGEKISVKVDGVTLTDQSRPRHGSTTGDMTAEPGVENTGTLRSGAGEVILAAGDLYSLAIRNSGHISAPKGDITLAASDGLVQNTADGLIEADVKRGTAGSIVIQGPSVLNQGEVSADARKGRGGYVELTSQDHTYLTTGSHVSAAGGVGRAEGGEVLIHSYNGQTAMPAGATVDVSGGARGGDGGFAEVSGQHLMFSGYADLDARAGYQKGKLLLDPNNLIINDNGGDDGFLNGNIIHFNEPNTNTNIFISDEALEALVGTIILQATGDIWVKQQVDLVNNNDITLQAWKSIVFEKAINGAHNLTAIADFNNNSFGDLVIHAPLSITGSFVFDGVTTFLNSGTLTSLGSQYYLGPVDLCTDMTLTALDVNFFSRVDATNPGMESLTIFGSNGPDGIALFDGQVGGLRKLEFLEVHGTSEVNGGLVRTKNHQLFLDDVLLGNDTTFASTDAGEIRFGDRIEGEHHLFANTAGLTRFDGDAGVIAPLLLIQTDDPGQTQVAGNLRANRILFNDPVSLADDVLLTGLEKVRFSQTIDGNGFDLIVNSPLTKFYGDATELDLLRTDADGLTIIGQDFGGKEGGGGGPIVITGNKIDFNDAVLLQQDAVITGFDFVDFDSTVNGDQHLTTNSNQKVRFGGDVGGAPGGALASLTTNVGGPGSINQNLVIIDGALIRAQGDIHFNPGGRSVPARAATIAARRAGGVLIESLNGSVRMGKNEKLTSLGNLTIKALSGTLTLGDLNALGRIDALASSIELWARNGGKLFNSNGQLIADSGADIIARDGIFFSKTPTMLGSGAKAVFATKSGGGVNQMLNGFEVRSYESLSASDFTFGSLVLDLTLPAALPPGPTPTDLATGLPGPTTVEDYVPLDPFALRPMERLAIYVRSLNPSELRGLVQGRELYNDAPEKLNPTPQELAIAVNRLRRDSVLQSLDRYSDLFLAQVPDEESGAMVEQHQGEHIRQTIAAAWRAYAAEAGGNATPAGFRQFLTEHPDHAEAMELMNGLRGLFNELWVMGVTRRELRNSLDGVLGPIVPEDMQQAQLEQALELDQIG